MRYVDFACSRSCDEEAVVGFLKASPKMIAWTPINKLHKLCVLLRNNDTATAFGFA